jgi:hypothetical protein
MWGKVRGKWRKNYLNCGHADAPNRSSGNKHVALNKMTQLFQKQH